MGVEDGVSVSPGELSSAAQCLDGIATDLDEAVRGMITEVRKVVGDSWTGPAATSHHDAWSDWFSAASGIAGALQDDAAALRDASRGYGATDAGVASTISDASQTYTLPERFYQ